MQRLPGMVACECLARVAWYKELLHWLANEFLADQVTALFLLQRVSTVSGLPF
jgi:hypothetical protein